MGVGGSVVYNQIISSQKGAESKIVQDNNEVTAIYASQVSISLEEGIKESDLVVEVEILGKDREEAEDEKIIPKTVHSAQILEVFSGELLAGDLVYILQDGIEDSIVNNIPIYQTGERYIFTLNSLESEAEYTNTYWATKVYFTTDEEVIKGVVRDSENRPTTDTFME